MILSKSSLKLNSLNSWLMACSAFSCLLSIIRVIVTWSLDYPFLPWNLFLAFIPYWITRWMINHPERVQRAWKFYGCMFLWLVFVPNAFYIVTDLFHLTRLDSAPKWFDILMVFSFAWNGILIGVISLRRAEIMLASRWRKDISFIMIAMVMWLIALGVYIGRYLRFNSWDIITDPLSLFNKIFLMLLNPIENLVNWGMTFTYAVFMTLLYYTIRTLTESFTIVKNNGYEKK